MSISPNLSSFFGMEHRPGASLCSAWATWSKTLWLKLRWVIFLLKEEIYERGKVAGISCFGGIDCWSHSDSEHCIRHVSLQNGIRPHGESKQCQSPVGKIVAGGKSP